MYMRILLLVFLFVLVSAGVQARAVSDLSALVEQALNEVGNNCVNMGRNVACYGYNGLPPRFLTRSR